MQKRIFFLLGIVLSSLLGFATNVQAAANVIDNPSFEHDNTQWQCANLLGSCDDDSINIGTDYYTPDGDSVLLLGESAIIQQVFRLSRDGVRSVLSFYYKSPFSGDGNVFTIKLVDVKNGKVYLKEQYIVPVETTSYNSWKQTQLTVPKSAKGRKVKLTIKQNSGTGYYDLFAMRKAAYATARVYVGGDVEEYNWMEPEPVTGAKVWIKDANGHRVNVRPAGANKTDRDRFVLTDTNGEAKFSVIDVSSSDGAYSVCASYETYKECTSLEALLGSSDNYAAITLWQ